MEFKKMWQAEECEFATIANVIGVCSMFPEYHIHFMMPDGYPSVVGEMMSWRGSYELPAIEPTGGTVEVFYTLCDASGVNTPHDFKSTKQFSDSICKINWGDWKDIIEQEVFADYYAQQERQSKIDALKKQREELDKEIASLESGA